MQIDFHHTATYVVARLAGFTHKDACTIAYASQYVDDSKNKGTVRFSNGHSFDRIASAHDVFDVLHNCVNSDDYQVWVPFHFLPGNNGEIADAVPSVPLRQRLLCTPDSPISNQMWATVRARKADPEILHRLGVTSHVYCDTFSHQLFAGFRDRVNHVEDLKCRDAEGHEFDDLQSLVADQLELGHGGALTHPDLPYLEWSYINGFSGPSERRNPGVFVQALERLFAQYLYFLGRDPGLRIGEKDLNAIRGLISTAHFSDANRRHNEWIDSIRNNVFSFAPLHDDEVGDLNYRPVGVGSWKYRALGTTAERDVAEALFNYDEHFEESDWKKFHDALKAHQQGVLFGILPEYRLPSSYEEAHAAGLD